jgi:hypothetical protein
MGGRLLHTFIIDWFLNKTGIASIVPLHKLTVSILSSKKIALLNWKIYVMPFCSQKREK